MKHWTTPPDIGAGKMPINDPPALAFTAPFASPLLPWQAALLQQWATGAHSMRTTTVGELRRAITGDLRRRGAAGHPAWVNAVMERTPPPDSAAGRAVSPACGCQWCVERRAITGLRAIAVIVDELPTAQGAPSAPFATTGLIETADAAAPRAVWP